MKPDVGMKKYHPRREHGTGNGALRWIQFEQDCQGDGGQWALYQGLKPALPIKGTELLVHVMKFVPLPQQAFVLEAVKPVEEKIKNERGQQKRENQIHHAMARAES